MRDYFNELIYERKKTLLPILLISILLGFLAGFYVRVSNKLLFNGILILIFINIMLFYYFFQLSDSDSIKKYRAFRAKYLFINLTAYVIVFFLNYSEVNNIFASVKVYYIPQQLYTIGACTTIYLIFIFIVYSTILGNIRRTKLTTSGIEIEIDDTPLNEKQYELVNNLRDSIINSSKISGKMHKYVINFTLNDLLDENYKIKSSYNYEILLNHFRMFSNEIFKNKFSDIVVDFKTVNNINNIVSDYNIPNNLYNKIYSRINLVENNTDDIFIERNLVFVNYRFDSLEHGDLEKNRIISIIEVKNEKEGYIAYGNLILILLRLFDCILAINLSVLMEEN